MSKKDNMKQAMYEMFGVGSDVAKSTPAPKVEVEKKVNSQPPKQETPGAVSSLQAVKKPEATSYFAQGTVLEGVLQAEGDVEIAGKFKGSITSKGNVTLFSFVEGNVTANSMRLSGCTLNGDVVANETVSVNAQSKITGNVTAKELLCAGDINGDLVIAENLVLEETARVNGNITTGAIAVVKGAVIKGGIEIKTPANSGKNQ